MGRRIRAKISGIAGYTPPKVMTNADLEKIVDTNDEWIRTRTGIRERHVAEKGVAASHMATEAAKRVLAQRGISAEEIDLIVVASVTPDMMFPATACLVQDRIGAKNAWGFDLSAACSGFVYALTVCAQFVGAGTARKALAIGSNREGPALLVTVAIVIIFRLGIGLWFPLAPVFRLMPAWVGNTLGGIL